MKAPKPYTLNPKRLNIFHGPSVLGFGSRSVGFGSFDTCTLGVGFRVYGLRVWGFRVKILGLGV